MFINLRAKAPDHYLLPSTAVCWWWLFGSYIYTFFKKIHFSQKLNQSLEQPPQVCGRVPITGGFQDVVGQGVR